MELSEEQKEIALRVAREMNYDPALNDLGAISKEEAMEFAARFLAALPKPEPVGEMVNTIGTTQLGTQFGTQFKHVEFKKFDSIPIGTKFYTHPAPA